jgi:hypothetical protein
MLAIKIWKILSGPVHQVTLTFNYSLAREFNVDKAEVMLRKVRIGTLDLLNWCILFIYIITYDVTILLYRQIECSFILIINRTFNGVRP